MKSTDSTADGRTLEFGVIPKMMRDHKSQYPHQQMFWAQQSMLLKTKHYTACTLCLASNIIILVNALSKASKYLPLVLHYECCE